jgi:fatty-acyl-CoA synthase
MPLPLTPIRFLYHAADLFADRAGIFCGQKQFTYSQFASRCERLAAALRSAGIVPGDRIAYLSLNNHQLMEGYYGVPMAGAVAMPLNVRLSPLELTNILKHSGARMLFFEEDFGSSVDAFRQGCPAIEKFIALNTEYEDFLATGKPQRCDVTQVDEDAMAELFYTSGSTGTPKGVMLSHRTVYLHGMSVATLYEEPESMVDLHTIPLFHANGWGHAHASTMLGVRQVLVRKFDPASVLSLIGQHRATDMSLVPTMANALLNAPNVRDYDLSSMRQIMIGGAASSPELIRRMEEVFRCCVCGGYGLTETAPVLTYARYVRSDASDAERHRKRAMAGRAVPGVEVRVADADLVDVPRDMTAIGEVVARGDHIMMGYYKDPEGTAAVLQDGWFHTGDMAVWDRDGFIQIVDRKKEIIVSGGENISSIEVERAIAAHPEVYECAVVAAPDATWGEVPAAIVVRKPGSALDSDQLVQFLAGRLGKFKMPRVIEFSEETLPKTGTGKIRKLVLKEKFWVGRSRRVGE